MGRGLACAFVFSACVRHLAPVSQPQPVTVQPAFLGDASGVYRVVDLNSVNRSLTGTIMLVSQANDFVSMVNSDAGLGQSGYTAYGGELQSGTECVRGSFSLGVPDKGILLGADATLHVGIGAASLLFVPPPMLQSVLQCPPYPLRPDAALSEGERRCLGDDGSASFTPPAQLCAMRMNRECDFDSSISGVYAMAIEAKDSAGTCTAPSLAGDRQWILTTANGSESTAIIGLTATADALELAMLASFNRDSGALALRQSLPANGAPWGNGSQLSAVMTTNAEAILLGNVEITRVLGDCTEHYIASGSRLSGAKIGASCPVVSRYSCPLSLSYCPALPTEASAQYIFTEIVAGGDPACPTFDCVAAIPVQNLCDRQSQQVASDGCIDPASQIAKTVAVTQLSADNRCTQLRCVSDPACAPSSGQFNEATRTTGLSCGQDNQVVFLERSGCLEASCRHAATDTACPPILDCSAFNATTSRPFYPFASHCEGVLCEVSDTAYSLTPAQKQVLRAGNYRIKAVHGADGGSSTTTFDLETLPTLGCPPVDLDARNIACPSVALDPHYDVCGGLGPSEYASTALYYSTSDYLCFGLTLPGSKRLIDQPSPSCAAPDLPCCSAPPALDGSVKIQCMAQLGVSTKTISFNVTNNLASTYAVHAFDTGILAMPNNVADLVAPTGASYFSLPRPLAHLAGYTVALSSPTNKCSFPGNQFSYTFASDSDSPNLAVTCGP
jgi:hypothetical protein